jgi:hypothetical protein
MEGVQSRGEKRIQATARQTQRGKEKMGGGFVLRRGCGCGIGGVYD